MELRTYSELVTNGLTPSDLAKQVRAGTLTRVRRGFYATPEELTPEEAHRRLVLATVPGVGSDSVLSHESAAVIHGIPVPEDALGRVTMTRPGGGHSRARRSLFTRNSKLVDDEVAEVSGLRVTTLARTAIDLARHHRFEWGVAACDAALRLGASKEELLEVATSNPRLRGMPRARQAAEFADGRAESPGESISRVQFARHGIPAPVLQFEIYHDGRWVARVDFLWHELGVVGEFDGLGKYGKLLKPGQTPESAIRYEKRREEDIRDAGWGLTRWDWDMAWRGAALSARVLRAAELQRGGRR